MTVDFDAVEDELNGGSSSDNDGDYEREDQVYDDAPAINVRPRSILDAEEVVEVSINKRWDEEQNFRGVLGDEPDGQAILVLKNPVVVHGDIWQATNGAAADYKVVGPEDDGISELTAQFNGEEAVIGIEGEGWSFQSELVDDFGDDAEMDDGNTYVKVFRGGMAGQRLLRTLDVCGQPYSRFVDPDGPDDWDSANEALFEFPLNYNDDGYNPTEGDKYPRVVGPAKLRTDLRGEPVRFVFTFGNGGGHFAHVVGIDEVGDDVDLESLSDNKLDMVAPGDEGYEDPDRYVELKWHDPESAYENGGSSDDTSVDTSAVTGNGTSDTVESYDDLSSTWQALVDELTEEGVTPDDLQDWSSTVEAHAENNDVDPVDTDVLADIVEQQA